jgi:putative endonuclease
LSYYLYILACSDATLYTGITTDLQRRVAEHNSSSKGAKYTKIRRPVTLVYSETFGDRSSASKREYAIKQLSRKEKLALIAKKEDK